MPPPTISKRTPEMLSPTADSLEAMEVKATKPVLDDTGDPAPCSNNIRSDKKQAAGRGGSMKSGQQQQR